MSEIFINYRTLDGKETAQILYDKLSERFGDENVFLASKSIQAGSSYADVLVDRARHSSALLALIGPNWLTAPERDRPDQRALDNANDWVRRELEEALAHRVLVIPVLLSRRVEQLDARELPPSLAPMAGRQCERLSSRGLFSDITRLGDGLVKQLPRLAVLDRKPPHTTAEAAPPVPPTDPGVHSTGQSGGIGNLNGAVSTFINTANGSVNTGSGHQFNGEVGNVFSGGNRGGIHQNRPASRPEDGTR